MNPEYKCLVTIPIYNHGSTIEAVALEVLQKGYPLLIVDDGCDATTAKQLIRFSKQHDDIHLLRIPQNSGKGAAFFKAVDYAHLHGYTHTFLVDADGQHNLEDLSLFEKHLNQEMNTAVYGSRVWQPCF